MSSLRSTTRHVLLLEPAAFGVNPETVASNAFQQATGNGELARRARAETLALAEQLAAAGIEPVVLADNPAAALPDAVFLNNWFSTHASGRVMLYPMHAPSRRAERRPALLEDCARRHGFRITEIVDLSGLEGEGLALEGTGSLVLDRPRRLAFAARSARTSPAALAAFAESSGYGVLAFDTLVAGLPVYHTNVMLALGRHFALVCPEAVATDAERAALLQALEAGGRELVAIDLAQLADYAANLLELDSPQGPVIPLSARALASLRPAQRRQLERHGRLLPVAVPAVEAGGGSVRCMLAENFLPRGPSVPR